MSLSGPSDVEPSAERGRAGRHLRCGRGLGGVLVVVVAAQLGCTGAAESHEQSAAEDDPAQLSGSSWLRGNVNARLDLVAKHLRGFDVAMAEVGYRYTELCWAVRDRNWDYAEYQLAKIETAVENGIERRPARAESARMLEPSVRRVRSAIEKRDEPALDGALEGLTETCNACHRAERVPFIEVRPPNVRLSPVHPSERQEGAP